WANFRIGHVTSPGWSEKFSRYSFVFNVPVRMREDEHEIERYLDLVAAAGAKKLTANEARTFIHLMETDRQFAADYLPSDKLIIGIQPGTSPTMRWKQWALERYRELIEQLTREQPDAQLVLFGAPNEVEMIQELAQGLENQVKIAAGKTTVKQVAALIERCAMLICNDSGLMHIAVAVG